MNLSELMPPTESDIARDSKTMRGSLREFLASVPDSFKPLVEDLEKTINEKLATGYYTRDQTDVELAKKAATGHKHAASDITSGGTTGAGFTVGGELGTTGDVRAGASLRGVDLYATAAPGFNITGTRVTAWLESATGRLGTASSSERFKTNVTPFDIDPEQILSIVPVFYQFTEAIRHAEWRRTCGPPYAEWDPKARAPIDAGMIAERLHEAGLWPFVVYERDAWGRLIRGADGDVIPEGIHYINWGIALQHVARWERDQRVALERRVDAIAAHLGLDT